MASPAYRMVLQLLLIAGVAGLSILFFFQTFDPMVLFFGFIVIAVLGIVMWVMRPGRAGGAATHVRVKCAGCAALNLENARFCSACGRAI